MDSALAPAIDEWHAAVNARDLPRAAAAVGDPVVVLGPRGAGRIAPADFAGWVERSGISLIPLVRHPVADDLAVVEQDARWPDDPTPVRVATVFRVTGGVVTAALRLPDLGSALDLARICHEMAASR